MIRDAQIVRIRYPYLSDANCNIKELALFASASVCDDSGYASLLRHRLDAYVSSGRSVGVGKCARVRVGMYTF